MNKRNLVAGDIKNSTSHRKNKGFTIVELIIIIVIIGLLVAISVVSYRQVTKGANDDQRKADIAVFQNELEKFYSENGVYPPGCPDSTCTTSFLTNNTSSSMFVPSMTITTMKTILPGINVEFGDPLSPTKTTPLMLRSNAQKEYYYFGGTINVNLSASSVSYAANANFPCTVQSALSPGQVGSYVVGYFSEVTNAWVVKAGRHGVPMVVNAPCVVIKS
ncbi:MAG TPA: prepilin-type N-terminal cleavage/methylation domain-containing protein [Candidatus Saccharimonadales bacterium]|nr:prepilin-type N-terminal cleavage/methylation domain-containing protein [Candidatus Saccharimonadales bacterium]